MPHHLQESHPATGANELINLAGPGGVRQNFSDMSTQIVLDPPQGNRFAMVEVVVLQQIGSAGKDVRLQFDLQFFTVVQDGRVALRNSAGSGIEIKVRAPVKITMPWSQGVARPVGIFFVYDIAPS
jgi:hypothetical protein